MSAWRARAGDESGSIVVVAGIAVLAFALLAAAGVEIAQWLQHRRHIQVRADAAALAGGQVLSECFAPAGTFIDPNADVENWAKSYGGITGGASQQLSQPYNGQFGSSSSNLMSFQSSTYPSASNPDPTQDLGQPCDNLMLDVKMTQEGIPPLFSISPLATVHGWARVELQQIEAVKPDLPLAIPDVNPKQADATFVNEATGAELTGCIAPAGAQPVPGTTCTFYLTKGTSSGGLTPWTGVGGVNIPGAPASVGVRIGLGGSVGSCANSTGGANYACYDINHTQQGVVMIRSIPTDSASSTQPVVRGVLPIGACSGSPFFADVNVTSADPNCAATIQAQIDFGTAGTNPTNSPVSASVVANIAGVGQVSMSPQAGSYVSGVGWTWMSDQPVSIPVDALASTSQYPITMSWTVHAGKVNGKDCSKGSGCTGAFASGNPVQRFTAATDDDDGPIKGVSLVEQSSTSPVSPYSLSSGTHTLSLTVLFEGNLSVQDPPRLVNLRLTGNGSRTTAANCDANIGSNGDQAFTNALLNGCQTAYQINNSDLCPDPSPPPGAPDCAPVKTGNLGQTVINAMNQRFSPCTSFPNNWPIFTQPNDGRRVVMMITDYSALGLNGAGTIPVTNFATFYIIGWSGNSCGDLWPFPYKQPSGGNIWGYFINYGISNGTPSGTKCVAGAVTPCELALVR